MTANDDIGKCSSEIKEALFRSQAPLEIIPFKNKQEGDVFYAYHEDLDNKLYHKKWETYHMDFLRE